MVKTELSRFVYDLLLSFTDSARLGLTRYAPYLALLSALMLDPFRLIYSP